MKLCLDTVSEKFVWSKVKTFSTSSAAAGDTLSNATSATETTSKPVQTLATIAARLPFLTLKKDWINFPNLWEDYCMWGEKTETEDWEMHEGVLIYRWWTHRHGGTKNDVAPVDWVEGRRCNKRGILGI